MIFQLLDKKYIVEVSDFVKALNITAMTVKRDFQKLE
ncbi:DeoR family transcriptional regulator [Aerococcus sp.]